MSSMKGSQSSISRDRKMATKHHENTIMWKHTVNCWASK